MEDIKNWVKDAKMQNIGVVFAYQQDERVLKYSGQIETILRDGFKVNTKEGTYEFKFSKVLATQTQDML